MLVIKQSQMLAMSAYVRESFEERMYEHLCERFPERTGAIKEEDLRVRISEGIDRAKGYGVRSERDVRRFLEFEVTRGPYFDRSGRNPWAMAILNDRRLNGTQKMDKISEFDLFASKGQ